MNKKIEIYIRKQIIKEGIISNLIDKITSTIKKAGEDRIEKELLKDNPDIKDAIEDLNAAYEKISDLEQELRQMTIRNKQPID